MTAAPGRVFGRGHDLPVAAHAEGVWVVDDRGRCHLDASGGAVVVGIGHGVGEVVEAAAEQARRVSYVHGTAFTTEVLQTYAAELGPLLPMTEPAIYPVSGGSEAVETALKMARAYHLARGEDRHLVIGREHSYHGNSRGALDVSGRASLRRPYTPWLGPARHVATPQEYRCRFTGAGHPEGCGARYAEELERSIVEAGPQRVAAFVAEPVAGAGLAGCVAPPDYWPAVVEVCRRHGVLVVADEVMTGFGRTGDWFACHSEGVRPDLLTAGKGAASGYWPLGLAVASGEVHDTVAAAGLVHGFTYSHHAVGAATGLAVLRRLREHDLVAASAARGELLRRRLRERLADHPWLGDVRGRGLLVGVELVADRASKAPFPRAARLTERVLAACREERLLVYPAAGCVDGVDGDAVLLGPPLVISEDEVEQVVQRLAAALWRCHQPAT